MTLSDVRIPRPWLVLSAAAVLAGATIMLLARNYSFYFDEWEFVQSAAQWDWISYLQPHNEHPVILPKLIYASLLSTVGLRSYLPYMLVLVALHATSATLLFELVRRRAGDAVGVASALVLLVMGAAWEDLLWAFQIAFVGSVACGLGLLLALEDPPGRRRLAAAAVLLTASLMFSGIGLFFGVVAVVRLAVTPARRRDLAWLAPVAIALAAWYVAFGHNGTGSTPASAAHNLVLLPLYVAWGLAGAAGGLIGVTGAASPAVLAVAVVVVALDWRRHAPDALALGVTAGLLSFYVVTGLARAEIGYEQSASGRYVYIGAVFWMLLLAGPARRLPWRGTWRPALAACLFLACFNSTVLLVAYGTAKAALMQREVADLQALDSVRGDPCLNPTGYVDPLVMPQVSAPALYYRAVDRYGDPAPSRTVTDRGDFARARANLLRTGCR